MKKAKFFFFLSFLVVALGFPVPSKGCTIFPDGESHKASWAEPIAVEGLPNFYCFGTGLYRGANLRCLALRSSKN